jgi:hypothetical protein
MVVVRDDEIDLLRQEIQGRGLMVKVPYRGVPKGEEKPAEPPEPPIKKGEVKVEGEPPPPPIRRAEKIGEGV